MGQAGLVDFVVAVVLCLGAAVAKAGDGAIAGLLAERLVGTGE